MSTGLILIAVAVIAFAAVMFIVVPAVTFRWLERVLEPRIAAVVRTDAVILRDLRANSLGLTSLGAWQQRGNGALVLTGDEILFFQAVPRRDVRVPLSAITEVKTVKGHLGKTYGRDLLYLAFDSPAGPDSIALFVRDLPAWLAALREAGRGRVSIAAPTG